MSPATSAPTRQRGIAGALVAAVRFRCGCGRSVAADHGSDAETTGRCSRCRSRAARTQQTVLHRR